MSKINFTFDRAKLIRDLEILKPVSGSEIKKIFNSVRFTFVKNENQLMVYLYGTNGQNFTCVFHANIAISENIEDPLRKLIEEHGEYHFLIDLEKLLKICKSSFVQNVIVREVQKEERDANGVLTKQSKYEIVTEGKNTVVSFSVDDFPNELFENYEQIAQYPVGVFGSIWSKASIAKGELDLRRTSMHYDGNFMTLDSSFASIVIVEDALKLNQEFKASINLDTGITNVLKKMVGAVTVSKAKSGPRILISSETDGIYISIIPVTSSNIPYRKVLESFTYNGKCVISRNSFENCLNRARAFVEKNFTSAISIKTIDKGMHWVMRIATIEDNESQIFEEEIVLDECNMALDAAYNSNNLVKIFNAIVKDKILISWRTEGVNQSDRTILIVEDNGHSKTNIIIPHMAQSG